MIGVTRVPFDKVPLNNQLLDAWSLVHLMSGISLGWIMNPLVAIGIMVLYEPFEILILYPFLYQNFGIVFGNETLINSTSDIVVNCIGVGIGYFIMRKRYPPPVTLFEGKK